LTHGQAKSSLSMQTLFFLVQEPERLRVNHPAAATAGFFLNSIHPEQPELGCTRIDENHYANVSRLPLNFLDTFFPSPRLSGPSHGDNDFALCSLPRLHLYS